MESAFSQHVVPTMNSCDSTKSNMQSYISDGSIYMLCSLVYENIYMHVWLDYMERLRILKWVSSVPLCRSMDLVRFSSKGFLNIFKQFALWGNHHKTIIVYSLLYAWFELLSKMILHNGSGFILDQNEALIVFLFFLFWFLVLSCDSISGKV